MTNNFSIITPSLNQSRFLEQAIKSVLDQAGDFSIDYIIADGGSTDGSVEIIKKFDAAIKSGTYAIKCRGIGLRWWSEPDGGQTQALNRGFKIGQGEICAWINSDDYYAPGAFTRAAEIFYSYADVDLVYGNVTHIYDNGEIRPGEAGTSDFKKNLEEGCQISQQGAFFTRRALAKAGYLDESLQYSMDYDLWLKILRNGKSIFIPDQIAFFRIWPESKTGSQPKNFRREEKIIRRRYGGSLINPMSIHRFRYNLKFTDYLKRNYPTTYSIIKKIAYKLVNSVKI